MFQGQCSDQCVWYGQCGKNPATNRPANCPYDGQAKTLNDSKALTSLQATCPELMKDLGNKFIFIMFI